MTGDQCQTTVWFSGKWIFERDNLVLQDRTLTGEIVRDLVHFFVFVRARFCVLVFLYACQSLFTNVSVHVFVFLCA